jgi:hypothetical protein
MPAKDFAVSKAFYQALGFTMTFEAEDIAGFAHDGGEFLLQNFYAKEWAENFMIQLLVPDLDAWWAHIEGLDLHGRFAVKKPAAPKMQPWGLRVAYVWGPSGELWHIAQG